MHKVVEFLGSQVTVGWSNGEAGHSIVINDETETTYTATVNVGDCFQYTLDYTYVPPDSYLNTSIYDNLLIAPNSFTPNGDGENDVFMILDFGPTVPPNVGDPNAYGITAYELIVFDRWGQEVYHRNTEVEGCSVYQGEIAWDGTSNSGQALPIGNYVYRLRVKTCNGSEGGHWYPVCAIYGAGNPYDFASSAFADTGLCLSWHYELSWSFPPWERVCDEPWSPENTGSDVFENGLPPDCVFSVLLIR